jgi:uroporphyrinogen decarboxylase
MANRTTRRVFLNSAVGATAALRGRKNAFAAKSKRDIMLSLLDTGAHYNYVPAAFFIHFDAAFHFGRPAVDKHLEFFRYTGMDFVKIQYERTYPPIPGIKRPENWRKMPSYKLDFYSPQLEAVKGLVNAAGKEALVLVTLYSPYMCAGHTAGNAVLKAHLQENPEPVRKGLEVITDSLMLFVKECVRLGVDGFYASTQGGEATTFRDPTVFKKYVKPFDLVLMNEMRRSCRFNILHICDYNAPYADLEAFLDYPGHVVNCNPKLTTRKLTWKEIAAAFQRPCMGGMDRHGIITSGSAEEITADVRKTLSESSERFVLAADCTLPNDIRWENIRTAIAAAHAFRR